MGWAEYLGIKLTNPLLLIGRYVAALDVVIGPTNLGWSVTGASLNGCAEARCFQPFIAIFSRERDRPAIERWLSPVMHEIFSPLVQMN